MSSPTVPEAFTNEQKEYLQGFFAGLSARKAAPFVGILSDGLISAAPAPGLENQAGPPASTEQTVFGTPISDLCEQEIWKLEQHGLDIWDKLLTHAEENKFPDKADTFRFRYYGLFYVAPAQNSFMLRCRIPAGRLTANQLRGLAGIAADWGAGYADITTRANFQIREIAPEHLVKVLLRLQELGMTSRGSGVDNIRNVTATPTAGLDPAELIDSQPYATALHYYILNNRDMYDIPRKFNVGFDGGGAISVVADTNDIGFVAVTVPEGKSVPPGVYFRVQLAGITGHSQFAADAGIVVKPEESVAVAAAIIRVFAENGDRTNRKKARLKYLVDKWGIPKFVEEMEKKLAFPLPPLALTDCQLAHPPILHGHLGVYKQKQKGLNYIGVAIPVGRLRTSQIRRIADLAENYGSGDLRLTVWQNLLITNVSDTYVETVKRSLLRIGLHYEADSITGGVIACTGNTGCKFAATNTKGQAVELAKYLEKRVSLDQPINIHLTGCPNSCAQHYIGDIGLLGVQVGQSGEQVEGYHVFFGGSSGQKESLAREVFHGIPFGELPSLLEKVLKIYLAKRTNHESFKQFVSRHPVKELQELFSSSP
ncbi:MAG TPA: NirA family protein [Chthoniobacterales bacterium]|nr:NirA family protein [Chthoniobacterales bacterium]